MGLDGWPGFRSVGILCWGWEGVGGGVGVGDSFWGQDEYDVIGVLWG